MPILRNTFAGAVLLVLAGAAWADNLVGKDEFLCASASVIICLDDGTCVSAEPWELNVPQFITVDLDSGNLATTPASGEGRSTKVEHITRTDGRIYLQGIDLGRAFSFVIHEATGFLTAALARDDLTVTVFGACTPTE